MKKEQIISEFIVTPKECHLKKFEFVKDIISLDS